MSQGLSAAIPLVHPATHENVGTPAGVPVEPGCDPYRGRGRWRASGRIAPRGVAALNPWLRAATPAGVENTETRRLRRSTPPKTGSWKGG